ACGGRNGRSHSMTMEDRSLHSDDDWMLLREEYPVSEYGREAETTTTRVALDPQMLEKRRQRKLRLSSHPSGHDPLRHIDQTLSNHCPEFCEPMWTLGAVARWVIERTSEAVDGVSISEEKLLATL